MVGDVCVLGKRHLRILAMPNDGQTICRDHRMRIAVRNVVTNRLSYIPEWRLLKSSRTSVDERTRQLWDALGALQL